MKVKYMRVSTKNQNTGRQEIQLDKLGINFDKDYIDKMTGKTKERPALNKMLAEVREGDTVYCESISRLGRSLKDLIDIIESLTERGVRVIIVKEGIDTESSTYKLLLAVFGGVAEMERETTQERVIQGVERAKETKETRTGRWFGRQKITANDLPKDFKKYYKKMQEGELSKVEVAKILGVARSTLYRWIDIYDKGAC